MPSLNQILAAHAPLLVLDAASALPQAGLGEGPGRWRWRASGEEAVVGLFAAVEALEADLASVRAFAYCEGPGSILGIRTAAMAIRSWVALAPRPVFSYRSLEVAARALDRAGAAVIADARRGLWHVCRQGAPLERLPASALAPPLLMPEGFRHWSPLPEGVGRIPYDLSDLLPRTAGADLFRASAEPDALLAAEPAYATWTPAIHRAPRP